MARPLVRDKDEVLANFQVLIALRKSTDPAEVQKYRSYLKSAKVLVVARVNGRREYAPSRFVGYRANTLAKHQKAEKNKENDGTVTNRQLTELFGKLYYSDIQEDIKFTNFCEQHHIDKELDGLVTPLKYIFVDYEASPSALLRKPKGVQTEIPLVSPDTLCYLVGAVWKDHVPENQLPRFLAEGIWTNGHEAKFTDIVKNVPIGAVLVVKAFFFHQGQKQQVLDVRARGLVTNNPGTGHDLNVDWELDFEPFQLTDSDLPGMGGLYWDTIAMVNNPIHRARLLGTTSPRVKMLPFPLNQILYGPPGTGKTYHTVTRAIALLENTTDEAIAAQYPPAKRAELRQKFEDYRQAQRIEFVTFHQAFNYEDFVEGIKPLPPAKESEGETTTTETKPVQYDVVAGVFRRVCESAAAAANTAAAPVSPGFDVLYDGFVTQLAERMKSTRGVLTFYSKTNLPVTLTNVSVTNPLKRLTFLHANSAQQDHHIDKQWIKKLYDKYTSIDQIKHLGNDITKTVGGSNATLMWVVFKELKQYEAAWIAQERAKQQTTPPLPFVLIIDEINRGNVANIFGELITLLEDDKRAGGAEALTVTLPYSKEKFAVPQNLYVLGTMNTADRSVEALDTALRRRFSFTEMLPLPHLLPTDMEGVNLRELLTAINARLEQLLDHDHCIGHALLIHVKTLDQLREAFRRSILPLLQEYFFGDWGKIGLVLGSAFIEQVNKKAGASGYKLLSFGSYSTSELSEKPVYRLKSVADRQVKDFIAIYAA